MNWQIRPFASGDEDPLARVCVRTGAAGADATGAFEPETLLPDLFLTPYLVHCPQFAWVVTGPDAAPAGYLVAAADTDAFDEWFAHHWWPSVASRYPRPERPVTVQERLIESGYVRGPGRDPLAGEYPAHLHLDLLPRAQGQGLGRRLVAVLQQALAAQGVPGVHLGASKENAGAIAFYHRIGFTPLPSPDGSQWFGKRW